MTLAEILASLFPAGHTVSAQDGLIEGEGKLPDGRRTTVIGVSDRTALGIDEALRLSDRVLAASEKDDHEPILVLVDSHSQRMSKRDELLGLNEYLAHLAKCLIHADLNGHPTVGILYGHSAAGAFIATALATRVLVALPGAEPEVMDLPSMSRVTKLSLDMLEHMSQSTPVFAPGLDNLAKTGGIHMVWDPARPLAEQFASTLQSFDQSADDRDRLGAERQGRPKAAEIAARVHALAMRAR